MAIFSGCPESKTPNVPKNTCPTMTTTVRSSIGPLYSQSNCGSINIPTETKKTAPKRSFTGLIKRSICSASTVSAKIEPIKKAPKAEEKPACVAINTIPRQRPMLTTSMVSSFRYFRVFFRREGIKYIPTTKQKRRKTPSLTTLLNSSMPSTSLLTASVESKTISRTANKSSAIKMPRTTPAKRWLLTLASSNALYIMVVDDIESIPPRKMDVICPQPRRVPVR